MPLTGAPGWGGNGWKPQTRKQILFFITPPLTLLFPTGLWPLLFKAVKSHTGARRRELSLVPSPLPLFSPDLPGPTSAPAPMPLPLSSWYPQPQQIPFIPPSICPSLYFTHSYLLDTALDSKDAKQIRQSPCSMDPQPSAGDRQGRNRTVF